MSRCWAGVYTTCCVAGSPRWRQTMSANCRQPMRGPPTPGNSPPPSSHNSPPYSKSHNSKIVLSYTLCAAWNLQRHLLILFLFISKAFPISKLRTYSIDCCLVLLWQICFNWWFHISCSQGSVLVDDFIFHVPRGQYWLMISYFMFQGVSIGWWFIFHVPRGQYWMMISYFMIPGVSIGWWFIFHVPRGQYWMMIHISCSQVSVLDDDFIFHVTRGR